MLTSPLKVTHATLWDLSACQRRCSGIRWSYTGSEGGRCGPWWVWSSRCRSTSRLLVSAGDLSADAPQMWSRRVATLATFAMWLDAGFRIPGTNIRFGLDPILGLIPGAGDAAGAVLAGWIFVEAILLGASRATLIRIAGNVALDAGLGAVPILGDIFDFAWKANLRNVALLERHLIAPQRAQRADRFFIACLIGGVMLVIVGVLTLGIVLTRWLFHLVGVA